MLHCPAPALCHTGTLSLPNMPHSPASISFPSIHAGLQHLDLLHNHLTVLPPALSAATALTCLVLSINTHLALSEGEVDGILARMPRLAELHIDNTDTHPAVLERLQRARRQISIQ